MKPALFIIERPTPQRAPVLNELSRRGVPIEVVYLHGDAAEQGWGDVELTHPHLFADRSAALTPSAIAGRITRGHYSVLVSMGYRGGIRVAALTSARATNLPTAMRFDTNQVQIEATDARRRILRRVLMRTLIPRRATAWAIGHQNERFWREEIGLTSIVSIPYEVPMLPGNIDAFEFDRTRRSDPDALRFLYVGRLAQIKNVADAIRAFRRADHAGWTFRIVGTGPDEASLRALAGDDTRISFVGSRTYTRLGADFAESDVLILPSSGEPWGLVVNEALGFGLRVIASDQVGAAYDLLTPETGQTYPVGDVDALLAALEDCTHHLEQGSRQPATNTADLMEADLRRLVRVRP